MDELLDTARPWLECQPGIRPWQQARSRIASQIDRWIDAYWAAACAHAEAIDDPRRRECAAKLWSCWEYHWRQAAEIGGGLADGFEVAGRLEAGLGFKGGGRLGGNPLEDLVLAVGVLREDEPAISYFSQRFRKSTARAVANAAAALAQLGRRAEAERYWKQVLAETKDVELRKQVQQTLRLLGQE